MIATQRISPIIQSLPSKKSNYQNPIHQSPSSTSPLWTHTLVNPSSTSIQRLKFSLTPPNFSQNPKITLPPTPPYPTHLCPHSSFYNLSLTVSNSLLNNYSHYHQSYVIKNFEFESSSAIIKDFEFDSS